MNIVIIYVIFWQDPDHLDNISGHLDFLILCWWLFCDFRTHQPTFYHECIFLDDFTVLIFLEKRDLVIKN